ncbi:hypothetical protein D6C87_03774 [Aureobasidium pullulans]|uniref:YjgF-like protein n=1 Tax=Aureobasidium pullulans TaxID=5580 RepID=A0AB38LNH5_AURPU|nr:hypothetical protein D6C94_08263 [Aureobasidium pullulans]THZ44145.1 hypothetical protein D6C87_03774 [Aureobasidium pullulans]
MPIQTVLSEKAFAPTTGILTHARIASGIIFTSGQIGADTTGAIVSESVASQAEQTIRNLESVLKDCGSSLDYVMNANIFLADPAYYAEFNEVYSRITTQTPRHEVDFAQIMPDPKPPRTCVFVGLGAGVFTVKCEMNFQAAVSD